MAREPYLYFQPEQLTRLRNLHVHARQVVEGFLSGLHRSPHRGFSAEFREHRDYAPGDDLRHLDWQAWGRSDRYYIKQYEQETNLRACILLDISASMDWKHTGAVTKFTYGCFLTACLSYLLARQQDAVGVVGFDQDIRFHLPPASGPAHLDRIFRRLESTRPAKRTALAETFHTLAERLGKRGLVIVISDLYDDPSKILRAFQHFVHKKHQLIVLHLLDEAELSLPFRGITSFVDMETGEQMEIDPRTVAEAYRREMDAFCSRYRRECGDRNVEYSLVTTSTPYDRMLLEYLARRKAVRR